MGKGFQADKTPEHDGERGEKLGMVDVGQRREGNFLYCDIARPPDCDNERDNQYRNQRLQVGAGAGAARAHPPDDRQRTQFGQQ